MVRFILILSFILAIRLLLFYTSDPAFQNTPNNSRLGFPIISSSKEKISGTFKRSLPNDSAALLLGIAFGEKGNFDKDYLDALRRTGVLHVIAASGMNVSMVAGFMLGVLITFLKRQHALITATIAIIIYSALADFEESIVRASIMAVFAYGAGLLGRQNTALLALCLAAFIMIMWDPRIITSVGFQLSFAATAGIILFDPVFKKLGDNFLLENVRTTTSAQLATVPILLFYFSSYSPVSILANLLTLWTVPPLMILGLIGSIASLVLPIIALPFLWLALPLLIYFKEIILFLNNFAPEFKAESIPPLIIIGYYCLVLAGILSLYKKLKVRV